MLILQEDALVDWKDESATCSKDDGMGASIPFRNAGGRSWVFLERRSLLYMGIYDGRPAPLACETRIKADDQYAFDTLMNRRSFDSPFV